MSDNFLSHQTYVPQGEDLYVTPTIRTDSQVHRVVVRDGVQTETFEDSNQKGHSGQINEYHGTDTWQATARTKAGRAVAEITGDTLVTIAGVEGSVDFFLKEGYLRKAADGTFKESEGGPVVAPEATNDDVLPINDGAMGVIAEALQPLPAHAHIPFTAHGIGVALGRFDDASLTKKFADASGLDIAESQGRVDAIKVMFKSHADHAIEKLSGIGAADRADFWLWCRETQSDRLRDAINKQVHEHDVSGYRSLAEKWKSSTAPSVAALTAAGIPTRTRNQGVEAFIAGKWMSPASAARAGLI